MNIKNNPIAVVLGSACLLFLGFVYYATRTVPVDFPVGKHFVVEENESLRKVSLELEQQHYIYSALLFRAWVSYRGGDRSIKAGEYVFETPHVLGAIVKRFVSGNPDLPLLSVTIPEGSTSFEVASLVHKVLPTTSIDIFGEMISKHEADGKLFPSTYFLLPSYTEEMIVLMMTSTFEKKVQPVLDSTKLVSPLTTRNDVLSLAAILEGEAKTKEDMAIVSGILQKRLILGMPLQVDVAKGTYTAKGLPFIPINNPGLVAIDAAVHPKTTSYLYYITGKDGAMHYAKTFAEHKANIEKFL
jgi:UPF0755 protein